MKNKVIYGLLALVIAFGIWLYVISVVSPESEATFYNVPVVFNNESVLKENGLMVVSGKNTTLTLVLSGNRSDLNSMKSSDITVIADLAKINEAGEKTLSYAISFPGSGFDTVEVVSSSPDLIFLTIAEWTTKEVDVVVDYKGEVPKDYIVDEKNTELDVSKVRITGPKSVVDQVSQATVEVNVDGQTQTISQSYAFTLCDADGNPVDAAQITCNVAEVNVTVRVLLVKEIELEVSTTNDTGISTEGVKITIEPQSTIKVAGSERLLADLTSLQVGTIDLATIMGNSATYTFEIPTLPEGVRNYSGITEVTVTVQFEGMKTKTLTVTNITENGTTPAGMEAKLPIQWEVILRGPEDQIDRILAENLTISVDLTNAQPGEDLFAAEVLIDTAFDGVEVIFVEDISVTLTETAQVAGT